jgi:protein tyrosine phosphatase
LSNLYKQDGTYEKINYVFFSKGDKKRTLSHLHFREWPDFGVPQSTDVMIQFCQTMRHHALAAEQGLILVHCRYVLKAAILSPEKEVDPLNISLKLLFLTL